MIDPDEYPELAALSDNHQDIVAELDHVQLWLEYRSDSYDEQGRCIFLNGDGWQIWPVYFGLTSPQDVVKVDGMTDDEVGTFCSMLPADFPATHDLLSCIPTINYAAFSRLSPRASLASHAHMNPDSLIMHMGLQVPPGCGLMVDGKVETWKRPGQQIIFDDNLMHSAWNNSEQDRIVLYVDFER